MSRVKVLLFIIAVYAILAGLCLIVPEDGIELGGVSLQFPGIKEVASSLAPKAKQPASPSPEELLEQRLSEIRVAENNKFKSYFKDNPARIHFPDDDVTLFDPFFRALDNAGNKSVRILHYGDSQIEEDRISSTIRSGLQSKFGGGGPGLMPFGRPYYTISASQSSTANLYRYLVFGEGGRRRDGRYGIMGQCARMDTSVYTTINSGKKSTSPSKHFQRLTLLAGNIGGSLNVKCNGKQYKLQNVSDPSGVARIVVDLPDSSTSVRFSAWGSADIYGMHRVPVVATSDTVRNLNELRDRIAKVEAEKSARSLKDLAVNGKDLLALGIPAGKQVGRILNELFQCVLDDPAMNERERLLTVAKNLSKDFAD